MPQSEETPEKTDDELYAELRREDPLQCAGCAYEIAWGEPFIEFKHIIGYSVRRGEKGYVKHDPYAHYDGVLRRVHIKCLHLVPEHF